MKKIICVQTGARRNYAVPTLLARVNLLEAFYTDLNPASGLGKFLDMVSPLGFRKRALDRFLKRHVPVEAARKTYTFDLPAVRYLVRKRLSGKDPIKTHQALKLFDQEFSQAMIGKGLGKATHVFSMFGEGSQFLKFAKESGLKTIVEEYLSPLTHKILQEERERFPEIELPLPEEIIQSDYRWFREICSSTDLFLAPSNFVVQGLEAFQIKRDQCRVVPYAVAESWLQVKNRPVRGRVLFVGTAELRKGIHILGMAAEKLVPHGYDFRVAGDASQVVRDHPLTQHLTFLGRVPRSEIHKEFAQADIFVLPSLSEGSAEVTYEALAVGLPIITTQASGSVVNHGIEGFIVPERDADALASAIEELLENPDLRERMARAAKQRAQGYTWEKYAERLTLALGSV